MKEANIYKNDQLFSCCNDKMNFLENNKELFLISVIIPVFNVEPYLRTCLDSVVNQTYSKLEILVIDDGSTDRCGVICDEFERLDERITVFHIENRGLSAARNLGIEKAKGDFFYFLDSDDWIDSYVLERAISAIGYADILCFKGKIGTYTGIEALATYIKGGIDGSIWSKLYRKECFSKIRFPEGRIVEDTATTYKLLYLSKLVICADIQGHHYRIREGSITETHDLKNIFDFCLAVTEMYANCTIFFSVYPEYQKDNVINNKLMQNIALSIARAWAWKNASPAINTRNEVWESMSYIARTMFPYSVRRYFPWRIRGGLFLARFNHPLSFWLANKMHLLTRKRIC